MTKQERKAAAALLLEWAEWCAATPDKSLVDAINTTPYSAEAVDAYFAARDWCLIAGYDNRMFSVHKAATAATGLCLAAAMIEAEGEL